MVENNVLMLTFDTDLIEYFILSNDFGKRLNEQIAIRSICFDVESMIWLFL